MKKAALLIAVICLGVSCSSTKKKGETGKFGRFYHNMTAKYNGYFNANEILKESFVALEESNDDNYSEILNLYPYQPSNPQAVSAELDRAIEKVSTVATLHRPSHWVDDCYLLLGKAQFLKQDYESAEETFRFFQEEFDPYNPYSSNYTKSQKTSSKEKKKQRDEEREVKRKELSEKKEEQKEDREQAKKERDKKREEESKARDKKREEEAKAKKKNKEKESKLSDEIRNLKKDLREAEKKRKDELRKKEKEARKKKKRLPKLDPKADNRSQKEKEIQSKIDAKQKQLDTIRDAKTQARKEKEELEQKELEQENEVIAENTEINIEQQEDEKVEEEEAAEKNKTKKKIEKKAPGGLFKHKPAYYEGMLWLAKTYSERGDGFSAEYVLKNLEEEPLYDHVRKEIPAAYAHLYLKQKDYDKAIPALKNAIEKEDDKKLKARYSYILGQIQEKKGNKSEALDYYSTVRNYKPSFAMRFNAELKDIKLSQSTAKLSKDQAVKKVEKMLKEDKYDEYRSQMYFAMGELELEDKNIDNAIPHFQKSLSEPGSSKLQQANVYYTLASIFYDQEEFLSSSTYYDSTLQVLEPKDERYHEVDKRSRSLKDIATNIKTIETQDSLLRLASLTRDELVEIAREVEKENEAKGIVKKDNPRTPVKRNTGARNIGGAKSSFFAYNDLAKIQGQFDFNKKWGNRALEDNWRRSNRADASEDTNEIVEVEEEESEMSDETVRRLLGNIPFSDSDKERSHRRISDAYYDLGVKYRDNLSNYKKSVETLEELISKYPTYEKRLDAYYYLYLSYNDLNNASRAQYYASKISEEFGESDYAKIISDPSYLEEMLKEENKIEVFYREAYADFENGEYTKAKSRLDQSENLFGKINPYAPKFALLSAMCLGSIEGKDQYIKALRDVTTRYPNTAEKTRAQEILRFLRGENDAFSDLIYEEESQVFQLADDKLHYTILVVYDISNDELNDLKVSISNYNKKFYSKDKLKVASIFLNRDDQSQIILIRRFKNKEKAMSYHKAAETNPNEFIKGLSIDYSLYTITQRNYREVVKQKSEKQYRSFFEKNYLEK